MFVCIVLWLLEKDLVITKLMRYIHKMAGSVFAQPCINLMTLIVYVSDASVLGTALKVVYNRTNPSYK